MRQVARSQRFVYSLTKTALLGCFLSLLTHCGDATVGNMNDANVSPSDSDTADTTESGVFQLPVRPVAVDTIAPSTVSAGQAINVTCVLLGENGEQAVTPGGIQPQIRFSPAGSISRNEMGQTIAIRTGDVDVRCAFPTLSLTDDTPATIRVTPGAAANTRATVDREQIEAGQSVTAQCEVYDAYGNVITDATPALTVTPEDQGTSITNLSATVTQAGIYEVGCSVPGAASQSVRVEVSPTLPAQLLIAKVPDQPVYGTDQVIEVVTTVSDRYGNVIDNAPVTLTSTPAASETFGVGRYRYRNDGRYTVRAQVSPPTENNQMLVATTDIVVNGQGPAIRCDSPTHGSMINLTPGTNTTFRGTVTDASGVMSVRVNGNPVTVASDGTFSTSIRTVFGINFVDIIATDSLGSQNTRTCAFLVSNQYAPTNTTYADTVALKLTQDAFDDRVTNDGFDSLNDILYTAANSAGLRSQLHTALLAANPLKPSSCDQAGPFGTCLFRSQIDYLNSRLPGPNTTSLSLITNGLRARVRFDNVGIQLRLSGTLSSTGWATASYIIVDIDFDTALSGGQPRVTVRNGSVNVQVGALTLDFSGLAGFVIDIIEFFAEDAIRNIVADQLRSYIANNFNSILDGVLSNLDISSLGSTINVPRLTGTGTLPMSFNIAFSHLGVTTARALFGIGTRFSTTATHSRPSLGVPIPSGTVRLEPTVTSPDTAGVSVHVGIFNQVLHALWRGGFFDVTLGGSVIGGGMPSGASAVVVAGLPPVAEILPNGSVQLSLGALQLDVVYPGLFTTPLRVDLGARATTTVSLVGDDLRFGTVNVSQLVFSTGAISIDSSTRLTLQNFLRQLIQHVVDNALNDSLPALPIPSFAIPSSLTTYGLPAGGELGLVSPSLDTLSRHFVLTSRFGIR